MIMVLGFEVLTRVIMNNSVLWNITEGELEYNWERPVYDDGLFRSTTSCSFGENRENCEELQ
jgi:hypothetical protein